MGFTIIFSVSWSAHDQSRSKSRSNPQKSSPAPAQEEAEKRPENPGKKRKKANTLEQSTPLALEKPEETPEEPEETGPCIPRFVHYEPSAYELLWYNDIEAKRHRVCSLLAEQTDKTVPLMTASYVWSKNIPTRELPSGSVELFSRLIYEDPCTHESFAELIEPLFGMLRDPFSICNLPSSIPRELFIAGDGVQSKAWLLSAAHTPVLTGGSQHELAITGSPRIQRAPKRILLDLGSNLFSTWAPDKYAYSSAYFFDIFKKAGVPFDRIFAYEFEKLDPHKAWDAVPKEAISGYTLINHGVEAGVDSKFNPWNLLTTVATPDDFVVVKLDIDTPAIEKSLFQQVMSNQTLANFIDEMYFEHHVYIPEMQRFWHLGPQSATTLATSYQWFAALRKMGIRMHSWP